MLMEKNIYVVDLFKSYKILHLSDSTSDISVTVYISNI